MQTQFATRTTTRMDSETIICRSCLKQFTGLSANVLGLTLRTLNCPDCVEKWERDNAPKVTPPSNRDEEWVALCRRSAFLRYAHLDPAKLPERARGFHPLDVSGPTGLVIVGETSLGKTFLAVDAARRAFSRTETVLLCDAIEFGILCGQIDSERRERHLRACIEADVLLLDDIGKVRLTPRVAEGLFFVAKKREDNLKPTIWTTNIVGKHLAESMGGEFGPPLVARIRRTCRTISL